MSLLHTLRFLVTHPLGRQDRMHTLARFARWQIASRVGLGAAVVPFVNDANLIVARGMMGATGNVYVGLHEFDDMAFVLRTLRPSDLFVDVGANIGSYTVLASKVVGARTVAVEPIPATFANLANNIRFNGITELVDARNVGLARTRGVLRFSTDLDTTNHVVDSSYRGGATVEVPVLPLDELLEGRRPFALKIDVEGFEQDVLAGAERTLASADLMAVLIELNDLRDRYGGAEMSAHDRLRSAGLRPYRYDAEAKSLEAADRPSPHSNYLFLRDAEVIRDRLAAAPTFRVGRFRV